MNNELYHYGVKGMKWGVRRYQNADGSLTPAGKQRFKDVSANEKLAKKETKRAIKKLKGDAKAYSRMEKSYRKAKNQVDHLVKADEYFEKSKMVHKKISDIESGRVKAGRDFVTAYRYNVSLRGLAPQISRRTTIIENEKKK